MFYRKIEQPLPVPLDPENFFAWLIAPPTVKTGPSIGDEDELLDCDQNKQLITLSNRIGGGEESERGQFPWHVAIYHRKSASHVYQCGGTLITKRSILTAAHCVTVNGDALRADDFLVYLGLHNLKRELGGEQIRKVSKIMVHPEYDRQGLYSDISVLKFIEPYDTSNTLITPICLWKDTDDESSNFDNLSGIVAGWGLNEHGTINENLTFLTLPVVSRAKCIQKNRTFYTPLLNGRTYCAGDGSGKSVCNGDSGGGMVFYDRERNFWRLRGVVSASIRKQNTFVCDMSFYAIFTDVPKFKQWITNTVYQ